MRKTYGYCDVNWSVDGIELVGKKSMELLDDYFVKS